MRVTVEAAVRQVRTGVEARAIRFGLVGHGLDEEDALEGLKEAVRAWCRSLHGLGLLAKALKQRDVDWSGDQDQVPELEVRVAEAVE